MAFFVFSWRPLLLDWPFRAGLWLISAVFPAVGERLGAFGFF
jgi:hypothetical protein